MEYGFFAGMVVGTANIIGLITVGQIDVSMVFDFFALHLIAVVASFFPVSYYVIIATIILCMYSSSYLLFHKLFGTLSVTEILWCTTNFVWVLFALYKVLPLWQRYAGVV